MRFILVIATMIAMTSVAHAKEFQEGQLWTYQTRPGDDASLVLINLVETVPKLGAVYHISVLRVHLPSWKDDSRPETDLPHFPVLKEALEKSVMANVGKRAPLEAYRVGYKTWREAFDAGQAGAFKVSIAEIVSIVETTVQKNRPTPSDK